jgi:hypothetical protein
MGRRCDACKEKRRIVERERHHKNHVGRRGIGVDGKRHNRCHNCNDLGHQAKTCHEKPAVVVEREGNVVRCSCCCGSRMAGFLDARTIKEFRNFHAACRRPRKVLVPEQFKLPFGTEAEVKSTRRGGRKSSAVQAPQMAGAA